MPDVGRVQNHDLPSSDIAFGRVPDRIDDIAQAQRVVAGIEIRRRSHDGLPCSIVHRGKRPLKRSHRPADAYQLSNQFRQSVQGGIQRGRAIARGQDAPDRPVSGIGAPETGQRAGRQTTGDQC